MGLAVPRHRCYLSARVDRLLRRAALTLAGALALACACSALPAHAGHIELVGHLDLPGGPGLTDVWGFVDGNTGREYALVGNNWNGIQVVEVTNPTDPILRKTVTGVPRQDIKSWGRYVYTVDGNLNYQGANGAVLDFQDPLNPTVVGSLPPAHNLFIDDEGYLYVCYPGVKIFDLNPDPATPHLVWESQAHAGHDACVWEHRLFDFSGPDGTFIYDVSNRASPVLLDSIVDPSITFHHSGWLSYGGDFLFLNDEFASHPQPDITVWIVNQAYHPIRIGEYGDSTSNVHNSYIIDNQIYISYYTAGFKVVDATLPFAPVLNDAYDTCPLTGEGILQGAWGVYPFSPSGNIFISDRSNGFYIFNLASNPTGIDATPPPSPGVVLGQNYPNPFNPTTTITFDLPDARDVELRIIDVNGRIVRTLAAEGRGPGHHEIPWDGRTADGTRVPSGVYLYVLRAGNTFVSRKMVVLK